MINISNYKVEEDCRLPKLYKRAAEIAQIVIEQGGSLKQLVFSSERKIIKPVYALVVETIKHLDTIDKIIKKSKLFKKSDSLQLWLSKILLTELLLRKRKLLGGSSWPVRYIKTHEEELNKLLTNYSDVEKKVVKPRYVRVNTIKLTPDEAIKIFREESWVLIPSPENYAEFLDIIEKLQPGEFIRDFHIKEVLVFPTNTQFFDHELYCNGSILLQDKASCLATYILNPKPKSVVWDMCAAPGMKTTHLSSIMKNKGEIYATELHTKRYQDLCRLVESAGCKNVKTFNRDAFTVNQPDHQDNFDDSWCERVEYILIDPSCSGSGMTDRVDIFFKEKTDISRLQKLCQFQFKLLMHALTNFPKVKRVVYSTCSTKIEENEMVISDVLKNLNEPPQGRKKKKKKSFKPKFELIKPLKDTWPTRGSNEFEFGDYCLNSNPEKDLTNGFFIAVFEKIGHDYEENDADNVNKKKKKEKEINYEGDSFETAEETEEMENNREENNFEVVKKKKKGKKTSVQEDNLEFIEENKKETENNSEENNFGVIKKKKKKKKNKEK